MNAKIRSIDLKPGMYVIVSKWLDEEFKEPEKKIGIWGQEYEVKPTPKPVGDPIKIMAMAMPYAAVMLIHTGARGTLDTRMCEFIRVDAKYVRALVPQYGKRKKRVISQDEQQHLDKNKPREIFVAKEGVWKQITDDRRKP